MVEVNQIGAKSKVSNPNGNKHLIIHKVRLGSETGKKYNVKQFIPNTN